MQADLTYDSMSSFDDFLEFLLKTSNSVVLQLKIWIGLIGLFVLMPLIGIVLFGLFLLTYFQKFKIKRWVKSIYNRVTEMSDEDRIRIHLIVERTMFRHREVQNISDRSKNDILFKQIHFQVTQIVNSLSDAEQTLRKAAYPHIDKPLSEEHQKELMEKFKSFDDWDDEDLDVYDRVYC